MIAVVLAALASVTPLRMAVAETAVAQVQHPSPDWNPNQRDCAGLVRFAYRAAYRKLHPERLKHGLWSDAEGRALDFADAHTLITGSFTLLGRDRDRVRALQSGDVLAFQQEPGENGEPVFHLMLVVRTQGASAGDTVVIYHPGTPGASVRLGALADLLQAPAEWRPLPQNPAFLGYFRFKEWMP